MFRLCPERGFWGGQLLPDGGHELPAHSCGLSCLSLSQHRCSSFSVSSEVRIFMGKGREGHKAKATKKTPNPLNTEKLLEAAWGTPPMP